MDSFVQGDYSTTFLHQHPLCLLGPAAPPHTSKVPYWKLPADLDCVFLPYPMGLLFKGSFSFGGRGPIFSLRREDPSGIIFLGACLCLK